VLPALLTLQERYTLSVFFLRQNTSQGLAQCSQHCSPFQPLRVDYSLVLSRKVSLRRFLFAFVPILPTPDAWWYTTVYICRHWIKFWEQLGIFSKLFLAATSFPGRLGIALINLPPVQCRCRARRARPIVLKRQSFYYTRPSPVLG